MRSKIRTPAIGLPEGWTKEVVTRQNGLSAGKSDVYYYSPQEQKFRSKKELINHLNGVLDLSNFDFRSGEIKEKKKRPTKRSKLPDKQVLATMMANKRTLPDTNPLSNAKRQRSDSVKEDCTALSSDESGGSSFVPTKKCSVRVQRLDGEQQAQHLSRDTTEEEGGYVKEEEEPDQVMEELFLSIPALRSPPSKKTSEPGETPAPHSSSSDPETQSDKENRHLAKRFNHLIDGVLIDSLCNMSAAKPPSIAKDPLPPPLPQPHQGTDVMLRSPFEKLVNLSSKAGSSSNGRIIRTAVPVVPTGGRKKQGRPYAKPSDYLPNPTRGNSQDGTSSVLSLRDDGFQCNNDTDPSSAKSSNVPPSCISESDNLLKKSATNLLSNSAHSAGKKIRTGKIRIKSKNLLINNTESEPRNIQLLTADKRNELITSGKIDTDEYSSAADTTLPQSSSSLSPSDSKSLTSTNNSTVKSSPLSTAVVKQEQPDLYHVSWEDKSNVTGTSPPTIPLQSGNGSLPTNLNAAKPLELDPDELTKLSSLFFLPEGVIADCTKRAMSPSGLHNGNTTAGFPMTLNKIPLSKGNLPSKLLIGSQVKIKIKKSTLTSTSRNSPSPTQQMNGGNDDAILPVPMATDLNDNAHYVCRVCKTDLITKRGVYLHMKRMHAVKGKTKCKTHCGICPSKPKTKFEWARHCLDNHVDIVNPHSKPH